MIIKDWNEYDQPREKLFAKGCSSLTDSELLAVLIGSGNQNNNALAIARKILSKEKHLGNLSRSTPRNLMKYNGIGKAKAIGIIAAFELGKRSCIDQPDKRPRISSSRMVFDLMKSAIGGLDHEEFWILLLNNANLLECSWRLSIGGITATLVDVRLIYKKAIEVGATSIILCHNHPSGNLRPSNSDVALTKKVIKGGRLLDIKVLDHLIITDDSYYSFADEGNL